MGEGRSGHVLRVCGGLCENAWRLCR
jgi:hypothetical protein